MEADVRLLGPHSATAQVEGEDGAGLRQTHLGAGGSAGVAQDEGETWSGEQEQVKAQVQEKVQLHEVKVQVRNMKVQVQEIVNV